MLKHDLQAEKVSKDTLESRLSICKSCDKFNDGRICSLTDTNIIVNAIFTEQACPLDKWQDGLKE